MSFEVDGSYHFTEEQFILDEEQTRYLATKGYRVIRFINEEITTTPGNIIH